MVNNILTASGLPYKETRFPSPPKETYAVYLDGVTADGPDGMNLIFTHDIMVEVYEPTPDPEAEASLEAVITAAGLHYTKQPRYWLESVRRYQVIYEFTYIEKRRA